MALVIVIHHAHGVHLIFLSCKLFFSKAFGSQYLQPFTKSKGQILVRKEQRLITIADKISR